MDTSHYREARKANLRAQLCAQHDPGLNGRMDGLPKN
jgi:hypothetical protein